MLLYDSEILKSFICKRHYYIIVVIIIFSITLCSNEKKNEQLSGSYNCNDFDQLYKKDIRFQIAKREYIEGNYDDALKTYHEILTDSKKEDNIFQIYVALGNIGLIYIKLKKFKEAENTFDEMKRRNEKHQNLKYRAINLESFGQLRKLQKKYTESIQYYKKALDIYLHCKQKDRIIVCLNHIGGNYFRENKYEKSRKSFLTAIKINKDSNNSINSSVSFFYLGRIFSIQKKYKKAKTFLFEALRLDKIKRSPLNIAEDLAQIGQVYVKQAKELDDKEEDYLREKILNKALDYFERSYEVLKNLKTPKAQVRLANTLKILVDLFIETDDLVKSELYENELELLYNKK